MALINHPSNYLSSSPSLSLPPSSTSKTEPRGETSSLENAPLVFNQLRNQLENHVTCLSSSKKIQAYQIDPYDESNRYFPVNDQFCESLEKMNLSASRDLHGWSLSAFRGLIDSMNQLMKLLQMSDSEFKGHGVLLKRLCEDINAASWGIEGWSNEMMSHFNDVLSIAEKQWEQANLQIMQADKPSLDAFSEMILAAEQLLSMQQMLQELQENFFKLPSFQSRADVIGEEMEKMDIGEEYANKKMMKRNLETIENIVNQLKAKLPDQLEQVEEIIQNQNIEIRLAEVKEKFCKKNFSLDVEKVLREYKISDEQDLDRYITAKTKLKGILSLSDAEKLYPEVHAFCRIEEERLNREEQELINFDELVNARMIKNGKTQPGLFSRICQAVTPDPSNWSERTKYWVHVACLGMQLIDHISKMGARPPSFGQKELSLTSEQEKQLNRETAYLGKVLNEKFDVLRNDRKMINVLSKRAPEIKPILEYLVNHDYGTLDSKAIMDSYRTYRQDMMLTGKSSGHFEWITKGASSFQIKPAKASKVFIDTADSMEVVKTERTSYPSIKEKNSFQTSSVPSDHSFEALINMPFEKFPVFLDWKARPPSIQEIVDRSFDSLKRMTWGHWLYNGGVGKRYFIGNVDEFALMKQIILEAPKDQKDFYALDIGAGNFGWGDTFAEYLEREADIPKDIRVHIIGVRGEEYLGDKIINKGRSIIYRLGAFKIEEISENFQEHNLDLINKVDLIISAWCLRHLADPVGTFLQAYHLLRPKSGFFLTDGFKFSYSDTKQPSFDQENENVVQLLQDSKAPFLKRRYDVGRSFDHFILKRPNANSLKLPMAYVNGAQIEEGWQVYSKHMTVFNRILPENHVETPLKNYDDGSTLDGIRTNDKNLFDWLNQNQLITIEKYVYDEKHGKLVKVKLYPAK